MDEQQFRRNIGLAKSLGSEYMAGYRIGLSRHYYGERYQLPASVETLSDAKAHGERAHGFVDGLHGRSPELPQDEDEEAMSSIYIELPTRLKARYVRAAQRRGSKLIPWCISALNAAAASEEE